jgi:hypothetical protein
VSLGRGTVSTFPDPNQTHPSCRLSAALIAASLLPSFLETSASIQPHNTPSSLDLVAAQHIEIPEASYRSRALAVVQIPVCMSNSLPGRNPSMPYRLSRLVKAATLLLQIEQSLQAGEEKHFALFGGVEHRRILQFQSRL